MKFWVKSIDPFLVEKGFAETTGELAAWLESNIQRSIMVSPEALGLCNRSTLSHILEKYFHILKVSTATVPLHRHIFKSSPSHHRKETPLFPALRSLTQMKKERIFPDAI